MQPLTIESIVAHWASRSAESPAISGPGRAPLDYGGLHQTIIYVRHQFRSLGIAQADRVALILGPGPSSVAAFLGVAACATSAPLNPDLTRAEFEISLPALRPRMVVVDSRLKTEGRSVALDLGIPILELDDEMNGPAGRFRFRSFDLVQESELSDHDWRAAPDDVAIVLHTSGSTGRPKCVALTQEGICRSSWNTALSLGLCNQDRCLNMLPMHHVHGLVSCILVPIAVGGCVVATTRFIGDCFCQLLDSCRPTWYSASPPMHHTIVEVLASTTPLPVKSSLRFVRSGSMPLWPALREALAKTFSVPVVEAYGMTEVPHISGNPPGNCRPGSVGQHIVDEWKIIDEAGHPLPAEQVGEVVVRGATVTPGYLDDAPTRTDVIKDGWFHTGDMGRLDRDGYLFLAGRRLEMINRGGLKVSPREIEEILLQHPGVRQAVAFAVDHPTLGQDVAAAIVSSDEHIHEESELRQYVASQLAVFKVPSRIVQVDAIPVEASGKVNRLTLADRLASTLHSAYEPPIGELEPLIAAVFEHVLRVDCVGRFDHFFSLGGDSLTATRATSGIRDQVGVDLPQRRIFESPTVAELAYAVLQEMLSQAESEGNSDILNDPGTRE